MVLGHGRRQLLWFEVTRHPTAEWLARQITEAFPWTSAPAYLVRDNDRAYGHVFTSRVRAMGIRDRPISPGSPWQNGYAERLIGTVRCECLDRMLIFGEAHLRRILTLYACYYNQTRTHLSLQKDAPLGRAVQRYGNHCRYARSWRDSIIATLGYDFRKGHPANGLRIVTRLNGETVQNGTTADMIFSVPDIIAHVSQVIVLNRATSSSPVRPPGLALPQGVS